MQPNTGGHQSSPGSPDDVAVEVTISGKLTVSARQLGKKLKWPVIVSGFVVVAFFMPRLDIEIASPISEPVRIHTQQ
ncbi:hypothetical protein [Nocardia salmonicida]|uniref:hypothetical protein n=1 Tax=Nocardia salmonicida TaxID=53431 RepID=UPI0037A73EEB